MDERTSNVLRKIHDALEQKGFSRYWGRQDKPTYAGELTADGQTFTVTIEISDFDFVQIPIIRFVDTQKIRDRRILPHILGPDGQICYLDSQMVVLDRYKPEGTIIWCLNRVQEVVSKALRGKSDEDLETEFFAYWSRNPIYIDLPQAFEGTGSIYIVKWHPQGERYSYVLVPKNEITTRVNFFGRNSSFNEEMYGPCAIFKVSTNLNIDVGSAWPPEKLDRLIMWLQNSQPEIIKKMEAVICQGRDIAFWFALVAPNCSVVFYFEVPSELRTKEFLQTRRIRLFQMLAAKGKNISIHRFSGQAIDEGYIFKRNISHMQNLSGKKILLIGCGTIGGFMAQYLAQSGAGTGDGHDFTIVDKDEFAPQNLGRHLLGVMHLGKNKAEACREFLEQQLPYIKISASPLDILTCKEKMLQYDLVVDATGEEALSIALNDFIVRARPEAPPILFVRLVGNGSAAQTIFCPDKEFACFKCEKPDLHGQERHQVVKSETDMIQERNLPCGDSTHIPFPVSRSVTAAALGLEVVLGWANANPRPHFRSRVLDASQAKNTPDGNPRPSDHCPACKLS